MLSTPFIGNKLNYILPSSILLFAALFLGLSLIGYESKAVKAMRGDQQENHQTSIERIYKGEICVLKDVLMHRAKESRKAKVKALEQ
jgi:hypothetical protein